MAEDGEVYKCSKCGLQVMVLESAQGNPFCCNEPMKKIEE